MLTRLPAFYFEYRSSSYNKQASAFALLKLEVVGLARLNLKVVLLEENGERREGGGEERGGKG